MREVPLKTGPCDYLLLVDRKAVGVIEAKKVGTTLSTVADQSGRYASSLPDFLAAGATGPLPFLYESTGVETYFRDSRDPDTCSRSVFAFHRPETLPVSSRPSVITSPSTRRRSTPCRSSTAARSSSVSPNPCSRNWRRNSETITPRGPKTVCGTPSPSPSPPRSQAALRPDALPTDDADSAGSARSKNRKVNRRQGTR